MAIRVDTTSWLPGAILVGDTGFGVLGSDVPASGEDGSGYLYDQLSLPADASKEVCGRITSWPSAGTLYGYEDTSFTFSGAPDGVYTFEYQKYLDGVATGSPVTVTLIVGGGNVVQVPTGTLTLTGYAPTVDVSTSSNPQTVSVPAGVLTLTAYAPAVFFGPVWPDPSQVASGVQYGPTGVEYTGTLTQATLKYWDGSQWVIKGMKYWNGSTWV